MDGPEKPKPKPKPRRKPDDTAQFERFFASIRKAGLDKSAPAGDENSEKATPRKLPERR